MVTGKSLFTPSGGENPCRKRSGKGSYAWEWLPWDQALGASAFLEQSQGFYPLLQGL